ncbi:hypothetical protein DEO72_LG9g1266 [Vigna unguiculata]|uniref:Uncharacterized protein n=1 Tax=Vigna unguiculata TaxID=3917 RepID=A0A4D6N2G4_VIGUN|nr:hypothetical protein DEO72_LG9g1266 [Vigna unguiculata]
MKTRDRELKWSAAVLIQRLAVGVGSARRRQGLSGVLDWMAPGGWIGSARRRRHGQWFLEQRPPGGVDYPARRWLQTL